MTDTISSNTDSRNPASVSAEPVNVNVTNFISSTFVRPCELADALDISERTLSRWHAKRVGPPRIRHGNVILYRRDAVRQWLELQEDRTLRGPPTNVGRRR